MSDQRQPTLLIDRLGRRMDETLTSTSQYQDSTNALEALNDAQNEMAVRMLQADRGWFLEFIDIDLVADQNTYTFPPTLSQVKFFEVLVATGSLTRGGKIPIVPFNDKELFDSGNRPRAPRNQGFRISMQGNNSFYVMPAPSASLTGAWRLWYHKRPAQMHFATISSASNATDIVFPQSVGVTGFVDPLDDYYNGAQIFISSGTGLRQLRTISDWVGFNTFTATVSEAYSPILDDTSVYEILSAIPEEHLELMILLAARRLLQRDSAESEWQETFGALAGQLDVRFQRYISQRQLSTKFRTVVNYA